MGNLDLAIQFYVDCHAVRGNDNIVQELGKKIERSKESTCQLYTGHRGVGKSTELKRLKQYLEGKGCKVIYFASDDDIDEAIFIDRSNQLWGLDCHVIYTVSLLNAEPMLTACATLGNLGRYEEAIVSYDEALKHKPDDHEAWYNRGVALGNLGRHEEAIVSYDEALKHKPDYHEAWYNRGIDLGNLGRYQEAIVSYEEALKHKPDKHDAWYNRGIALLNLGRYEEAIASYEEALKHKPDNTRYKWGLVLCKILRSLVSTWSNLVVSLFTQGHKQ